MQAMAQGFRGLNSSFFFLSILTYILEIEADLLIAIKTNLKNIMSGLKMYLSLVECLPHVQEALGSIPSTT